MKKIIYILLLICFSVQGQIKEKCTISFFTDPHANYKENGFYTGFEFGYEGTIYAKIQVEDFSVLTGGYTSYGGVIGVNFNQQINYSEKSINEYVGVRLIPQVFRNGSSTPLFGIESGIDYNFKNKIFIGLRATYDYREDMILLGWTEIWRFSGFVKLGYKFDLK